MGSINDVGVYEYDNSDGPLSDFAGLLNRQSAALTDIFEGGGPSSNSIRFGPHLLQWGTITTSGTRTVWTGTALFATPFSSPPSVALSNADNSAASFILFAVRARYVDGFTWMAQWLENGSGGPPGDVRLGSSHSGGATTSWFAIGQAA